MGTLFSRYAIPASQGSLMLRSPHLNKASQRQFPLWGLYHTMISSKLNGPRQVAKRSSYLTGRPAEAGRGRPSASLVHFCAPFQRVIQDLKPALHPESIPGATHLPLLVLLPCEKSNRGFSVTKGDSKHHRTVCSLIPPLL